MSLSIRTIPKESGFFRGDTEYMYEQAYANHGSSSKGLLISEQAHKTRLERAGTILSAVSRGGTVLDIGCGYGGLIPHLPPGLKYYGMDLRAEAIGQASKLYPDQIFRTARFEDLVGSLHSFDYVVALGVTMHLLPGSAPLDWFAKEICRIAKKGVVVEFQDPAKYRGSLTSHPLSEVAGAFFQRPRGENCLTDEDDTTTTVYIGFV